MKTFYLVDGHAQIFRAYYAPMGELTSPSGEPTKATYLFTQMMLSILREKKPDYFAVALDHGDKTTDRRSIYPEYKANRDEAPDDFGPQCDRIVEILGAMQVPMFVVRGQEADDIIATIANDIDDDVELRIVSRDKDLYQCLSDRVKMWDPSKDLVLDADWLEKEKGFTPAQAVDIQTLTGDSVDNIPGVPGIGPKKAMALIQKYGSVKEIVAHADELTPKMRENILAHGDEKFELTRQLVTLKRDVKFDFDLEACRTKELPAEDLLPIFRELEFKRLVAAFEAQLEGESEDDAAPPAPAAPRGTYRLINKPHDLDAFLADLEKVESFAIDTETTSLHPVDCELIGLSFSWKTGEGVYIALRSNTGDTLDPESTLEKLRFILEDPTKKKCGQNIKYDRVVLKSAGIELQGVDFDSMVASYLVRPERRSHAMDALARDLLNYETVPISDLIGKGKKQISMLDVELEKLGDYAAEDADITWRLRETLEPEFTDEALKKLFTDVEMPLVEVLAEMEYVGVSIDVEMLAAINRQLESRIGELTREIYEAAGREFKIESPKQLSEILFDEIGLRVVKKTKTSRSTDASVLQILVAESEHPLPKLVLEYRELAKLRSTYVEPLPSLISEKSGRVHASFHQAVAATGRLSSSNPNLQNIPIRTEQGREIRKAFVPSSSDRVLITADYSQIELRILAHLSQDPALLEAFRTDQDIHTYVAAQINDVAPEDVTRDQRSRAKAVNFGIIYGQGAFGLSRLLGISRADASSFINDYKARYPGIVRFMDECVNEAQETGSVRTMLGRKRPIPELASSNRGIAAQGERLAINTVVQGSAADMIKVAMVHIHERIKKEKLDLDLLIQVHDELVFEAPKKNATELAEIVREEMVNALPLDVPLRVDVASGDNWLEGKD